MTKQQYQRQIAELQDKLAHAERILAQRQEEMELISTNLTMQQDQCAEIMAVCNQLCQSVVQTDEAGLESSIARLMVLLGFEDDE